MAGATARIPTSRRILTWGNVEIGNSRDPVMNLSSTVFGFLEEEGQGSLESISSDHYGDNDVMEDNEERENSASVGDKKSFWETQHQLLQATLSRTSSLETRIRNATKEAIKEFQLAENVCICLRPVATGCRNCLMREVCSRLQNAGFNSAICKSKWSSSPDIPSGKHTFLDVVDSSNSKKKEPIRVIIELNFRAEFEMARANEEYNQLLSMLPEIFVGKVERLSSLIKILCSSAKKCMKEKKMHMAPWRKHGYMQAKWLRTCERTSTKTTLSPTENSIQPVRPRASMLTVDLLENLSNLHCTVVEVV